MTHTFDRWLDNHEVLEPLVQASEDLADELIVRHYDQFPPRAYREYVVGAAYDAMIDALANVRVDDLVSYGADRELDERVS